MLPSTHTAGRMRSGSGRSSAARRRVPRGCVRSTSAAQLGNASAHARSWRVSSVVGKGTLAKAKRQRVERSRAGRLMVAAMVANLAGETAPQLRGAAHPVSRALRSLHLAEAAAVEVLDRLPDLGFGVHHERPVSGDRLVERLAAQHRAPWRRCSPRSWRRCRRGRASTLLPSRATCASFTNTVPSSTITASVSAVLRRERHSLALVQPHVPDVDRRERRAGAALAVELAGDDAHLAGIVRQARRRECRRRRSSGNRAATSCSFAGGRPRRTARLPSAAFVGEILQNWNSSAASRRASSTDRRRPCGRGCCRWNRGARLRRSDDRHGLEAAVPMHAHSARTRRRRELRRAAQ